MSRLLKHDGRKVMSNTEAKRFLERYDMDPERIVPARDAAAMCREMERGLAGQGGSLQMIPTYLSGEGQIPQQVPVAVIDAGGTNYRRALVTFADGGYRVEHLSKWKMPGVDRPVTWEEFISFAADSLMDLLDITDRIGFCFSYSAEITPERDGRVVSIDKEVVVTGSEGKLLGASLIAELERRGIFGKKLVVLNDTVAVLLGGSSVLDRSACDGFVGQVSGTGSNTCCSLPIGRIGKLHSDSARSMIINLESGMYDGIPQGQFDKQLDAESHNPGQKTFEKQTAGVYLGELTRLMLRAAAKQGLLSAEGAEKAGQLEKIDSAVVDAWACGERLEEICGTAADEAFVRELCTAVFARSARCMCTNLAAILLLTGEGKDPTRPACICAEGSLVQKGRVYRPLLERLIDEQIRDGLGRYAVLRVGQETTLPGSAAAALLNT